MRRRGLAGAVAGLMLLAAVAPAWGGEVAAPYPQLFPWRTTVAGAPVTTTDRAATPAHQAVKATDTSAAPAATPARQAVKATSTGAVPANPKASGAGSSSSGASSTASSSTSGT